MLLFGAYGKRFILLISAVTVISSLNAGVLFSPRILYAMADDGLLPQGIAAVNRGGTPGPALLLCFLVTFSLVLIGSFETLIAIVSVLFVAVYLSGFVALLVLRKREPSLPRPYKAWWYPWSTVFVVIASAAFLIGSVLEELKHALFTAVLVLLTYLASLFVVRPGKFSAPIDVRDR
jgi:basic amino acid/polyamine antiporter, APA family